MAFPLTLLRLNRNRHRHAAVLLKVTSHPRLRLVKPQVARVEEPRARTVKPTWPRKWCGRHQETCKMSPQLTTSSRSRHQRTSTTSLPWPVWLKNRDSMRPTRRIAPTARSSTVSRKWARYPITVALVRIVLTRWTSLTNQVRLTKWQVASMAS